MSITKDGIKEAQRRLEDSYMPERYRHLRSLQRKLLGFDDEGSGVTHTEGIFVYYEPMRRTAQEYEKPNRILNNLRLLVSQTRSVEVVPDWTGLVSEEQRTARKAWWVQRSQGIGHSSGWKDDADRCDMDFKGLGIGFLKASAEDTGEHTVMNARYRSPLHVGFDPYAMSPLDSDWTWDADVWSIEQASERFPDHDFEKDALTYYTSENMIAEGVIIIEYYHKRPPKGEPGYMAILKDFRGEVLESGENPWGDMCPHQAFVNYVPPGSRYPVGLIEMQSYASKRIDEIDEMITTYAKRGTQVVLDVDLLDDDSLEQIQDGKHPQYILFGEGWNKMAREEGRTPFTVIPRDQVPSDLWQERQFWEQYLRESSGVSSAMAGVISPEQRTATEINQVAQQSSAQSTFMSREFMRCMQSFAVKMATGAKLFDDAPFYVMYGGLEVLFNDGSDIHTTSEGVWSGPLSAVFSEEDLTVTDMASKQAKEWAKWMGIFQITQSPAALKKAIESQGIHNPDDYMPSPQPSAEGGLPTNALGAENSPMMPQMG